MSGAARIVSEAGQRRAVCDATGASNRSGRFRAPAQSVRQEPSAPPGGLDRPLVPNEPRRPAGLPNGPGGPLHRPLLEDHGPPLHPLQHVFAVHVADDITHVRAVGYLRWRPKHDLPLHPGEPPMQESTPTETSRVLPLVDDQVPREAGASRQAAAASTGNSPIS